MKRNTGKQNAQKQQGNIMLVTAILILIITIIVATCVNLSNVQSNIASTNRNTSNTYVLAVEGVDKRVDEINKSLSAELSHIVDAISKEYVGKLADDTDMESDGLTKKYTPFSYKEGKITIENLVVPGSDEATTRQVLLKKIDEFLNEYYYNKKFVYKIQSDREKANYFTEVSVETLPSDSGNKEELKLIATATTKIPATSTEPEKIYDSQKVEAKVKLNIPTELQDEIREYYGWKGQPAETVDNSLVCFSDLIVGKGGKLKTTGDVLVKGIQQGNKNQVTDSSTGTSTGGVADPDTSGGVIVKNGGKLEVDGNLLTISNVSATNGWDDQSSHLADTQIKVTGDVVANTVGILDDYYEGGANQQPKANANGNINIVVNKNVIADNDVLIDRFTKDCKIDVTGTIYGTSGGTYTSEAGTKIDIGGRELQEDPNASSGVFSQGENSIIQAGSMYIGGQPFVTLAPGQMPFKLFESIGEPFTSVISLEEYGGPTADPASVSPDYLKDTSPFYPMIKADKVITSHTRSFVAAKMSFTDGSTKYVGVDESDTAKGISQDSQLTNKSDLWRLLFMGGGKTLGETAAVDNQYTSSSHIASVVCDSSSLQDYYNGNANLKDRANMYCKKFKNANDSEVYNRYSGVKAYSIAMRSIFYKGFTSTHLLDKTIFEDVVDLSQVTSATHEWEYENPIIVNPSNSTINVADFYVKDDYSDAGGGTNTYAGCYPTIIVNKNAGTTLTIKGEPGKNKFNGVIISKGPVVLDGTNGKLEINGSIIVGGPEATDLTNENIYNETQNAGITVKGEVELVKDANMLFSVEAKDRTLYRSVLNALKLTQYTSATETTATSLEKIMKAYNCSTNPDSSVNSEYQPDKVEYTVPKLVYTKKSYLTMDTDQINLTVIAENKVH